MKPENRNLQEQAFLSDMGHKARVERLELGEEYSRFLNEHLKEIGEHMNENVEGLKQAQYLGSCAVHYYKLPYLEEPLFVSQPGAMQNVPEIMVQSGISDLRNAMLRFHGHKPQLKRSGAP